jgi:hypothetical protein
MERCQYDDHRHCPGQRYDNNLTRRPCLCECHKAARLKTVSSPNQEGTTA